MGFARRVGLAAYEDKILFLASALAFDALLAALPFTVLILGVLGYVVGATGASGADVHALFDRFFPAHRVGGGDPFARAEAVVLRLAANPGQLSLYGAPFFLWFATRFYGSVRAALNEVFDTEESRRFVAGLAVDFALVVITTVLFVGNTLLTAQSFLPGFAGRLLAALSAFGFGLLLFFVVYLVAPSRRMHWETALIASLVASLAFEIAKKLFGLYLAEFATIDRLFSNANALAALLFVFWAYYTMCAFLIGGEVAETFDLARRQRQQRATLA